MDTLEKLTELRPGNRYTIVGMGEFGFPYQFRMVLEKIVVGPYAQYPRAFILRFRPQRKKLSRLVMFYDTKPIIVWEGWLYPDTQMFPFRGTKDYDSGSVEVRRSFPCFDSRYMQIARDSVKQSPVVEVYDPPSVVVSQGMAVME